MEKWLWGIISISSMFLAPALVFAGALVEGGGGASPLPEPTSLLLIASGFIGVLGFRKISKK